jgi:hypothetical protein
MDVLKSSTRTQVRDTDNFSEVHWIPQHLHPYRRYWCQERKTDQCNGMESPETASEMQNQFNGERKSFQQIASELDIHKQ